MSEMTECNHCKLRVLQLDAREKEELVHLMVGKNGVDVYIAPAWEVDPIQKKYWSCWFMELGSSCEC